MRRTPRCWSPPAVDSSPTGRVPVWFMRQAGRSLPEYRELRHGISMLESCSQPDLVAEITLQPVRRYGVDAAIFYSDIMVPLRAAGVDLEIVSGQGPIIANTGPAGCRPGPDPAAGARRAVVRHRGGRAAGGRARTDAADRVRRGAVHPGQLSGRGRAEQGLRPDQGDDDQRAGAVGRALLPAGRAVSHLPADPGRRRRLGGAAVRLLGRQPERGGLRPVRPAVLGPGARAPWPTPACRGSTSAWAPPSCSA